MFSIWKIYLQKNWFLRQKFKKKNWEKYRMFVWSFSWDMSSFIFLQSFLTFSYATSDFFLKFVGIFSPFFLKTSNQTRRFKSRYQKKITKSKKAYSGINICRWLIIRIGKHRYDTQQNSFDCVYWQPTFSCCFITIFVITRFMQNWNTHVTIFINLKVVNI